MRVNVSGSWWQTDALGSVPKATLQPSEIEAIRLLEEWNRGREEFTFITSGSTGAPKAMSFRRHQLEASAKMSIQALGLKSGMTALACLDTRYVAGAMMVVRTAVAKMHLIIRNPSSNPLKDLDWTVDFLAVAPLQIAALLDESLGQLNKTAVVIVGGGPIPNSMIPRLQRVAPACFATYGMTETLTHVALRRLNGKRPQTSFHLLPTVSAHADDRGCLVIEAPHLGPKPIETNDLVEWTKDGGFRVMGRIDSVINSGGIKVQPARVERAVEQVLTKLSIARRYFVAGVPDERLYESVVLVTEGLPFTITQEEELKKLLASKLGKFEMPRLLLYCPRFVETATQKIDRIATLDSVRGKTP